MTTTEEQLVETMARAMCAGNRRETIARASGSAMSSAGWNRTKTKATADAAFIAAARNAVPRLIATLAARDAEVERMKWALTQARVDLAACAMIEAAKSHGLLRADGLRQTIAKIDAALKEIRNV